MSAFQDMVDADIEGVFLNLDEFGSMHAIDGNDIPCLIENVDMEQLQGYEGIGNNAISLHARADKMPDARISGDSLNVDGTDYTILRWDEAEGMATVTLYQPVAYGYRKITEG